LSLGKDSRNPGHQTSARYFFGGQFALGAGQQIDLRKEGCLTQINALYVIRKTKQYNTSWFHVWWQEQDKSGSTS